MPSRSCRSRLRPVSSPDGSTSGRSDAASGLDLAAIADPNLTPVLGRYFERSWSHGIGHRLYDTDGKGYLDFANGIAVSALGHRHPAVTKAIHEQVDRLIVPTAAIGFSEPVVRLAAELAATFPAPLDTVMFLNSGLRGNRGRAQARPANDRPGRDRRLPGWLPRADVRGRRR